MNKNYEDIIKEKVNIYMEQIEVPKNLGGIIMEDFEKMKNEETNQPKDEKTNKTQKNGGKKLLIGSVAAVSAVALIGTGVFVGSRFLGNQNITINGSSGQSSGMVANNKQNIDLVTDAYTYDGNIKLDNGESKKRTYKIPQINIDSEDVKNINDEITEKLVEKAKAVVEKSESNELKYSNIEYEYYTNGDILSVLIKVPSTEFEGTGYYTYNVNKNTGKRISNEELIKEKNISLDKFTEEIMEESKGNFIKENGTVDEYVKNTQTDRDFYDKQYAKVTNKDNYKVNDQMLYLNQDGKIVALVASHHLAGSDEGKFYTITVDGVFEKVDDTKNTETSEKTELSKDEISKLQSFINKGENNPFTQLYYNNPEDIFKNEENQINVTTSASYVLSYAFNLSNYTREATNEEIKVIWKGGEAHISTKAISEDDLIKFLNEKLDYTYSKDTLRTVFKSYFYSNLNNVYITTISDALARVYTLKEAYRENGKIYVTVTDRNDEDFKSEVVLTEKNGNYYFYSCNPNIYKDLTTAEIKKLENYMNEIRNNMFTLMTYSDVSNFLNDLNNSEKDKALLKYSISHCSYVKKATTEQVKKLYNYKNESDIMGDTYLISEDNFIKYLEEEVACQFTKENIKEAFKEYWSNELNMYYFSMSDTAYTPAKIKSGSKDKYRYYLELNHGQKVAIFERNDGSMFFESCQGFDGKIGE